MSRRIRLLLAATFCLLGLHTIHAQDTTAAAPATDDVTALKAENAELKKEVADAKATILKLQTQIGQGGAQPAAVTETPAPAGPQKALPLDAPNPALEGTNAAAGAAPAIDTTNARSYTVVKGDSLWKIAHKMYPHDTKNGVDKLTEANKDAIGGKPLKIGQVLVVPQ